MMVHVNNVGVPLHRPLLLFCKEEVGAATRPRTTEERFEILSGDGQTNKPYLFICF